MSDVLRAAATLNDPLPLAFYARPTQVVARELIGKAIIRELDDGLVGGIVVETEAYLHRGDAASHATRGLTASNRSMFAAAGTAYVYPIHARHCFNVSTEGEGVGAAVLIRALQPVWGMSRMIEHRRLSDISDPNLPVDLRRLTSGPGRLCEALRIDRRQDGDPVTGESILRISIHSPGDRFAAVPRVRTSPRIGVTKARNRRLRYFADGNRFVSGRASDHSRPRSPRWDLPTDE